MLVLSPLMNGSPAQRSGKFKVSDPGGLVTRDVTYFGKLTSDNYFFACEIFIFLCIITRIALMSRPSFHLFWGSRGVCGLLLRWNVRFTYNFSLIPYDFGGHIRGWRGPHIGPPRKASICKETFFVKMSQISPKITVSRLFEGNS